MSFLVPDASLLWKMQMQCSSLQWLGGETGHRNPEDLGAHGMFLVPGLNPPAHVNFLQWQMVFVQRVRLPAGQMQRFLFLYLNTAAYKLIFWVSGTEVEDFVPYFSYFFPYFLFLIFPNNQGLKHRNDRRSSEKNKEMCKWKKWCPTWRVRRQVCRVSELCEMG